MTTFGFTVRVWNTIVSLDYFILSSGYQSALFTTPIIVFRAFLSILQFPQWLRTFVTVLIFAGQLYMASVKPV